jgi:RNA polymerase sigma-70 factor (ECF subfamily)
MVRRPTPNGNAGQDRRGNEAAFRELYERHRASLLRFVRRLTAVSDDFEAIAQETWLAVVQGRDRYTAGASFRTYLFSIAHRRSIDRWRQQRRFLEIEAIDDAVEVADLASYEPDAQIAQLALRSALVTAVARLPFPQREVFLLRAEGELTMEEIAEVVGTSPETAKSRLRYALKRLRCALDSWT